MSFLSLSSTVSGSGLGLNSIKLKLYCNFLFGLKSPLFQALVALSFVKDL
jgi:hypothetical protein